MENLTDEELMHLVMEGKLDMMRHLFNRYHSKIYNFSLQMIRDKELSKDITQEVFYKIIKHRHTYKLTKFSSWIYTIARNLCNDHYRSIKKKEQQALTFQIIKDDEETLSDTDETNKNIKQLNNALNQLSNSDKELIIMSRYQGMRYQEIATITDSTVGAVKTKIHRALHKLKDNYFINIKEHDM